MAREMLRVRDKPRLEPEPGESGEEGASLEGLHFGQGCEKLILCVGWAGVQVNVRVMSRHMLKFNWCDGI